MQMIQEVTDKYKKCVCWLNTLNWCPASCVICWFDLHGCYEIAGFILKDSQCCEFICGDLYYFSLTAGIQNRSAVSTHDWHVYISLGNFDTSVLKGPCVLMECLQPWKVEFIDITLFSNNASTTHMDNVKCNIDWKHFKIHQSIRPLGNCTIGMTLSHHCIFQLVDINGSLHM